jgi:DHA2 family multidrug resistance protein
LVAGILFVIRSLTFARPVVDLRALGNRNFLVGCVLSFITGVGIFSTIFLTPLFLGYVRGYSAWQTGIAIASTGAASLIGVPIYIMLARKIDTRWLMMAGMACFGLGIWSFSFITHDWGSAELFVPQILRGFPQVFIVAPAVNLGLGSLSPERLKYASGLFNMMRNLGGAIGIAVCATLLNDRTNLHFLRLAEHLNATNTAMSEMLHKVSNHFAALNGGDIIHGQAMALKQLWSLTLREAQVQTFADAFRVIAVCFVIATVMVPLLRKVAAPAAPSAEAH